jgi:hypothetical protein
MFIPEGGDEGADKDVHYVASPGSLTHVLFKFMQLSFYVCAFSFQELNVTLDA